MITLYFDQFSKGVVFSHTDKCFITLLAQKEI
jgi:hypothetical protein